MLLSVFLPFLNFLVLALFGRLIGRSGAIISTLYLIGLTVILNCKVFYFLFIQKISIAFLLGTWINFGLLNIVWEFLYDPLAGIMLIIVSLISFIVHIYSFSYMKTDPHFVRFISYLSLFTFFIFILVTAANFVQLFVGWEGVGACSYLLINFWFTRVQAGLAALKAIFINRIGDIGLLLAISLIIGLFKTLDFTILGVLVPLVSESYPIFSFGAIGLNIFFIDAICSFLLLGVVGKSAQFGLHTWLPSAIEGPTPVSALIHAATIVTAGIFLFIRVAFFFEASPPVRLLALILGGLTALLAAFTAIFVYDIKRIIAYSTCSQLGFILVACGLSQYTLGLFHLINHAFFKALLFLTAGAIIHTFSNEQDIRKLAGLFTRAPFIYAAILIGNISIIGLPFLSGFYSKDLIIEVVYLKNIGLFGILSVNLFFVSIIIATICTAIYSFRLHYFLFLRAGVYNYAQLTQPAFEQPFFIRFVLSSLIIGSIFSGYVLSDIFSVTNNFFYFWSSPDYTRNIISWNEAIEASGLYLRNENEFLPWYIKLLPFICNIGVGVIIIGFSWAYTNYKLPHIYEILEFFLFKKTNLYNYKCFYQTSQIIRLVSQVCQINFYINEIYNYSAWVGLHYSYQQIFKNLDKGVFEFFGPTGLAKIYLFVTRLFSKIYEAGLGRHVIVIYTTLFMYFILFELFL